MFRSTPRLVSVTVEDLEQMEIADDRYDLIRGKLHRMSPTVPRHAKAANRINVPLAVYVAEHRLGEVLINDLGFVLARDPDTLLGPDIAFVRAERMPPEEEQGRFARIVPDLVVEIVSPSDRPGRVVEKMEAYVPAGVPLVWFVDPQRRSASVRGAGHAADVLGEDGVLDGGEAVPGFRLPLSEVFR